MLIAIPWTIKDFDYMMVTLKSTLSPTDQKGFCQIKAYMDFSVVYIQFSVVKVTHKMDETFNIFG